MKFFLAVKNINSQGHLDFEKIDILCENGERYTALNAEYLNENDSNYYCCISYLPNGRFKVAPEFYYQGLRTKLQMASQIKNFIIDNTSDGVVEFWGFESASAWVNLTQTFANNPLSIEREREEKFKEIMPTFCRELRQVHPSNFVFPFGVHDAQWVKNVYDNLMTVKELDNKALYASIMQNCERQYFNNYSTEDLTEYLADETHELYSDGNHQFDNNFDSDNND